MKNLKISTQLILENAVIIVTMIIMSVIFITNVNSVSSDIHWVDHTHEVIEDANVLMGYMIDQETGVRGYSVSGDEEFLDPYHNGSQDFDELIKSLQKTVSDNPAQVERLQSIEILAGTWKKEVAEKYIAVRSNIAKGEELEQEMYEIVKAGTGKQSMDNLRQLVAASSISQAGKNKIILNMVNMETGLRGFLLNEGEEFLEPYIAGKSQLQQDLNRYNANSSIRQAAMNWVNNYAEKMIALQKEEAQTADMIQFYAEFNKKTGKKYMDELRQKFAAFIEIEQNLLDERRTDAEETVSATINTAIFGTLFAVLLGGIIVFLIIKSISASLYKASQVANSLAKGDLTVEVDVESTNEIGQLQKAMKNMAEKLKEVATSVIHGAENISGASEQMSATSQQIAQGAGEQASSIEEISSTMEQIAANIQQNSDNALQTQQISLNAKSGIEDVNERSQTAVKANQEISSKIGIINDIAFQTNILALNAAVEAARAGEHGKGFAVVASEVRKLAEKSKIAAEEIVQIAENGLNLTSEAGKKMDQMLPEIVKTTNLVQEISAASNEQTHGAAQVNNAMQQLNNVAQQNAASSEELASSAEEMSAQSSELKSAISFFKIDSNHTAKVLPLKTKAPVFDIMGKDDVDDEGFQLQL